MSTDTITSEELARANAILAKAFPEKPKEYYRGAKDVEYVWHNTQADPELIYDGKRFNYYDIEDALRDMFEEENPELDVSGEWADTAVLVEAMFDKFVQDNCVSYLQDVIFGGYFDGSEN